MTYIDYHESLYKSCLISSSWSDPPNLLAIGLDGRGRNVEMLYKAMHGTVVIYHAFTPPTKKFRREIEQLRRQR